MSNVEFLACPRCLCKRFTEPEKSPKRSTHEQLADETEDRQPIKLKCKGCGEVYTITGGKLIKNSC